MKKWKKIIGAVAICTSGMCAAQTKIVTPYEWYPVKSNSNTYDSNLCKEGYVRTSIESLKQGKNGELHYEFSTEEKYHKGTLKPQLTQEQMAYGLMLAANKNKKLPVLLCMKPSDDDTLMRFTYPKPYVWKPVKAKGDAPCGRDGKFDVVEIRVLSKNSDGTIKYHIDGFQGEVRGTFNPQKPKQYEIRFKDLLMDNVGKLKAPNEVCLAYNEDDPLFYSGH